MIEARSGDVDGLPLDNYEVGKIYEVPSSVGSYLVAVSAAEPVDIDAGRDAHQRGGGPEEPSGGVSLDEHIAATAQRLRAVAAEMRRRRAAGPPAAPPDDDSR